jgi:hypothetical protein
MASMHPCAKLATAAALASIAKAAWRTKARRLHINGRA